MSMIIPLITGAIVGGSESGSLNDKIDNLEDEWHLKGYNWCGPGTKVEQRLARGDKGVNRLDEACKSHDILYTNSKDEKLRSDADIELAKAAVRILQRSSELTTSEADAALLTALAMAYKADLQPEEGFSPFSIDWTALLKRPTTYALEKEFLSMFNIDKAYSAIRKLRTDIENAEKLLKALKPLYPKEDDSETTESATN